MQEIDFLPAQYRQKHVRRQWQPWRIVVVVAFVVLLVAAVLSQQNRKRQAERELAAIMPQYELAVSRNRRLAEIQAQLSTARNAAELFTYLRHPWPRTQLLAALWAPLPEAVTLRELKITPEMPQGRAQSQRRSRTKSEAEDGELAKLPPAVRDLKRLRDECDTTQTVVLISGMTSESAALHRYLGELGRASLFTKADLDSLESAENDPAGTLQFRATLVVRPGYGQPGGPTIPAGGIKGAPPNGPEKITVAETNH
jgi:hypothetical protein